MPHSKQTRGNLGVSCGLATRLTLVTPLKSKATRRSAPAALPVANSTGAAPTPSSAPTSAVSQTTCGPATLETLPPTLTSRATRRAAEAQCSTTDSVCAAVAALARSVKPRTSVASRLAFRRKDHRRPSKSPPPTTTVNQTFYVNFPSLPTPAATFPELAPLSSATPGHGSVAATELSRPSAAPKGALARNDLRNFLARHRAALGDPAATAALASPSLARDSPSALPPPPDAGSPAKRHRPAPDRPRAEAPAGATLPTLFDVPQLAPLRPTSSSAAAGVPQPGRPTQARKRRDRFRRARYAELSFLRLPAHLPGAQTAGPPDAVPVLPPPPPPTFAGNPGPLRPVSPAGLPPLPPFGGLAPPLAAPLPPDPAELRAPPLPPPDLSPDAAHLAVYLGLLGDDDPVASSARPSPVTAADDHPSDMDISPLGEAPPPILRPARPAAGALLPVARRGLTPYLCRSGLPPEASRLPSGYSISRAVALASGDNSVPPDLLPRLRTVLAETKVGDGLYIRDLVTIALEERADPRPTPCPAGPGGDHPGPRAPRSRRPPGPGPAPVLPGPALPASAPRALSTLSLPPTAPSPAPSSRASPLSSIGDFSVDLDNSGSDSDATSLAASEGLPPTPPGATPFSSPSPVPARRHPRSSASPAARRPAARATLNWPPRSRHSPPPDTCGRGPCPVLP